MKHPTERFHTDRPGGPTETQRSYGGIPTRIYDLYELVAKHGPVSHQDVADRLGVPENQHALLHDLLTTLTRQGRLAMNADGRFRLPGDEDIVGHIGLGEHRARVIKPVPSSGVRGLIPCRVPNYLIVAPGDLVMAKLSGVEKRKGSMHGRSRGKGGFEDRAIPTHIAEVVTIIQQRPKRVMGIVQQGRHGHFTVRCTGRDVPRQVRLDGELPPGLREGMLVRLQLFPPDKRGRDRGELIDIVGDANSPDDDARRVAGLFDLPWSFSTEAWEAALALPVDPDPADVEARLDLTGLHTLTIDPEDAKDFDDAISLERHEDGTITLGVHIADVAYWVRPDTPLDAEARHRGATVYLPGHTLHMLPEPIAVERCSLRQGVPRLALSCMMRFDPNGRIVERRLARTLIEVDVRLAYPEVLGVLAEGPTPEFLARHPEWTVPLLRDFRDLADTLRTNRYEKGAVTLNIQRPELILDERGAITAIQPEEQDDATNLVEECMLAANRCVAWFLRENALPYLCRAHPDPDPESLAAFANFLREFGRQHGDFTARGLQDLLEAVSGTPEGSAIHLAFLKSLERASYEATPVPHFALQFEHYTHFTSPIRRYPDLIVHQVLHAFWDAGGEFHWDEKHDAAPEGPNWRGRKQQEPGLPRAQQDAFSMQLPVVAEWCSERSRRADMASMDLTEIKILRRLKRMLGQTVEATIQGFTRRGPMALVDDAWVEGMIDLSPIGVRAISSDRFYADVQVGGHRQRLKIGDRVKVRIDRIDPVERHLDLLLYNGEVKRLFGSRAANHATTGNGKGNGKKAGKKNGRQKRPSSRRQAQTNTGDSRPPRRKKQAKKKPPRGRRN